MERNDNRLGIDSWSAGVAPGQIRDEQMKGARMSVYFRWAFIFLVTAVTAGPDLPGLPRRITSCLYPDTDLFRFKYRIVVCPDQTV